MGKIARKKGSKHALIIFLLLFFSSFRIVAQQADTTLPDGTVVETIHYTSDSVQLKGYVCKPKGKKHFPVYMWNHGSEKYPAFYSNLASFWVKKGYIFFMPIRSGQSDNAGPYISDEEKQIKRRRETQQAQFRQIYALHEKVNEDVIAALNWIKKQPYTDSNNIVVSGLGYGGIQVLLTAEKNVSGVKSFIAFSPGIEIWNTTWADSLPKAISIAKRPVLLLQSDSNYFEPYLAFKPSLDKKRFPSHYTISGEKENEEVFSTDYKVWEKDILKFLKDCGVKGKK